MNFKVDAELSPFVAGLYGSFQTVAGRYAPFAILTLSGFALACFNLGLGPPQRKPSQSAKLHSRKTKPIHAIHTLVTPSQGSSWPMPYHELAARAEISQSNTITLPINLVVLDFISGLIQIRGYENDITWLLQNSVQCFDWTVMMDGQIHVDKLCTIDVPLKRQSTPEHEGVHCPPITNFTFSVSHLYDLGTHITLDHIPPQDMHSTINQFKCAVAPDLKHTLEFSVLHDVLPLGVNLDTIMTPFIHRYSSMRSAQPQMEQHYRRYPSPLMFTFASMITMLTSTTNSNKSDCDISLEIVFTENVSAQYTRHLLNHSHALVPSPPPFGSYQDSNFTFLPEEERRADALMLRFEAALYPDVDHVRGLGLLRRFIVVVRRRRTLAIPDS